MLLRQSHLSPRLRRPLLHQRATTIAKDDTIVSADWRRAATPLPPLPQDKRETRQGEPLVSRLVPKRRASPRHKHIMDTSYENPRKTCRTTQRDETQHDYPAPQQSNTTPYTPPQKHATPTENQGSNTNQSPAAAFLTLMSTGRFSRSVPSQGLKGSRRARRDDSGETTTERPVASSGEG